MTFKTYLKRHLSEVDTFLQSPQINHSIDLVISKMLEATVSGKPLLFCGNGGSAADASHIVGELCGKFFLERKPLKALCLSSNSALITAWANDVNFQTIFSRQVEAHGQAGGILFCLSTSGNSQNIIEAAVVAKNMGIFTVGLTGHSGGLLRNNCDILLNVPSDVTSHIQELHVLVYHYICEMLEAAFVKNANE
jgi:D-sedoheptulose 7-phosphate isomerase